MNRQRNTDDHALATFLTGGPDDSDTPWRPPYRNGRLFDNEERQQFLPPVKLDPGWEGTNRPMEELNFRSHVDQVEEMEKNQPPDRLGLVYIIMVIHGIGILMPWNMFINAKSYFEEYKLDQGNETTPEVKEYSTNFMSYIGMAAQFPNAIMNLINLFCQCGGKAGARITCSIIIMVLVFILTVILAMIDTSTWPVLFFWMTLGSSVILNSACGVYQNSMYGVAAILPMKYTNAIIFGNNFSGTFVALLNILAIALAPDIRTSAIYYFVTAIVVLLIAFDAYFILPLTKFFRHFQTISQLKEQRYRKKDQTCRNTLANYWKVFREIWVLALSVWFVFFVSLALFPQIQSDIKRIDFPIADMYWPGVFCFLSFNFFAMLGNLLTECVRKPGPRWVWLPILLRVLFIPVFLLCNFRPDVRAWPVLINNDYVYIVAGALMSLTSGYFTSLCMMYAPKKVSSQNAGTAGMMMAFFLVFGILCGINASRLLAALVNIKL